jgi:UDP-2,3-diacylglucosamine hydrolase
MPNQEQPTALFVADSHFHLEPNSQERLRLDRFLGLLSLAHQADHLFLLGDIFDFWFDYPHFRLKGYEELLQALDRVREAGTRLHFVGGNHDIWAADYMLQRYNCSPLPETETLQLGSLRVRISHGDGLLVRDWFYNSFRALVRNRAGIVLAKSLHPELLYRISTWLSHKSRTADRDERAEIEAKARAWLNRQTDADWDLMVMGHLHQPFECTAGGRRLALLGGWIDTLQYGWLEQGEFRLMDFEPNKYP